MSQNQNGVLNAGIILALEEVSWACTKETTVKKKQMFWAFFFILGRTC